MPRRIAALLIPLVAACSTPMPVTAVLSKQALANSQDLLLLGEQHDAPLHRDVQRQVIESLSARARLAAVALEMAEQGQSTAGLAATATEQEVRSALRWDEAGWQWPTYAPVVMAAVRAGVPVLGANMPRARMREAMADASLDGLLAGPALKAQQQAIRSGHCDLLPESQIAPMTRIQIARDRSMAQVLQQALVPGKTVVLIAGARHVDPVVGVPQHLPESLRAQPAPLPPQPQKKDYCEEMRRQAKPGALRAG